MNQTSWVIRVLEDSSNRSIEYSNRLWLRRNVEKMQIKARVSDCVVNTFDIAEEWDKEGTILIQEGKKINFKDEFHPGKEALLLTKGSNAYMVYLYSPKE